MPEKILHERTFREMLDDNLLAKLFDGLAEMLVKYVGKERAELTAANLVLSLLKTRYNTEHDQYSLKQDLP